MLTRDDCLKRDRADPLSAARERFILPDGVNYLDGNSLGAVPKGVAARVARTIEDEWGTGLIRSWNAAGWYELPGRIGAKLAPLLGAAPHQVTVTDTISVNLFKLLVAAARLRPGRKTIVAERGNFPSDNHIVESVARMLGLTPRFVPAGDIINAIDEDTAVVELSHVNYRTAEIQDMAAVARGGAPQGRAGRLGSGALERSARAPPRCGPRRFRGRLRLQVPQRRTGRAVACLRRGAASQRPRPAAHRLVRACETVRLR